VSTPPLTPAGLRCAHRVDPLGVAPDRVALSWLAEGPGSGRAQAAYQVEVTDADGTAAWDSGRVASDAAVDIAYQGRPLARGGRYRWRVRIWDEAQMASEWSEPARFEIELDPASGWHASWIGLGQVRESFVPPTGTGPADPLRHALTPICGMRSPWASRWPGPGCT